jgi:RHS repeat-associated protein
VGPQQRIDFEYDFRGRRIGKKVWNNTAGTGTPAVNLKFLYDGWNLVAEVDGNAANALLRSYMWGLDLSGTLQDAGGVGGLLAFRPVTGAAQFAAYDGNGNVTALVDGSNGTVTAEYEYGAFGEPVRMTGTQAAANPIRFSSKFTDNETDLVYYGYRFYNPSTGRWLSRDPIEEDDGPQIYAFVHNNPLGRVDIDGQQSWAPPFFPSVSPRVRLQPNQGGSGPVHRSRNSITLWFSHCCNCDAILNSVFADLKNFRHWGDNSVANLNLDGNIGSFSPKKLAPRAGVLLGNDSEWKVRFSADEDTRCVSARTLDDHPLVGVRRWCVSRNRSGPKCVITISTEAYERPRDRGNEWGSGAAGYKDQQRIWEDYLGNTADWYRNVGDGCFQKAERAVPIQESMGSTNNPWLL